MLIHNFGITLSRLTTEDIELVRYWRNSRDISQFMEYKEFITEEQQRSWFNSLDLHCDFYFLINWNGQKVGLIHTSNINWKEKTAHAGLFVWHKDYISTHIPVLASLAMLECFFYTFKLTTYFAKVGRENKVAIRYNQTLGFTLLEKSKESNFDLYVLQESFYRTASEKLKRFAATISPAKQELDADPELLAELKNLMA